MSILYLSGHVCALRHPLLGFMNTPAMGNRMPPDVLWGADNGRFSKPQNYSDTKYLSWLARQDASRCLFATAPDTLGNHAETVALSRPLFPKLRASGYKPALVAQDGWDADSTPWGEFDVLFIGGSTEFKLGQAVREATEASKARGLWVHMGRVNSYKRLKYAESIGCDSADGTFLAFGPKVNGPKLIKWLDAIQGEQECSSRMSSFTPPSAHSMGPMTFIL